VRGALAWWQGLVQQYHSPPLPLEAEAPRPVVPLRPAPGQVHHCGHAHRSYATSPRTYQRQCLPCHQRQFAQETPRHAEVVSVR